MAENISQFKTPLDIMNPKKDIEGSLDFHCLCFGCTLIYLGRQKHCETIQIK